MRVSRETAARNRENVVKTASRQFREHGYDGIGIAGLMKAAGLTQGGFYKQFADKDAIITEATQQALDENLVAWQSVVEGHQDDPLNALRRWYLSREHVDRRDAGCAYAALAAEAPRHGKYLQDAFCEAVEKSITLLTDTRAESAQSRCEAIRLITGMVGALVLSRAVGEGALSQEVLDCAILEPRPGRLK
ncbi:hypothetical protein B0E33_29280 (plasmid) [Roseibium algicola]|uniref:HTH tetR-type domain-containing protein n=1 Tax=Roseibium algicola TaxID=2857014 RepID=A0ABM6IBK8_9HYPH|nr:TetR/AcrR family transcriptional regulator [Roseibium aggregatum]AQQ07899.1 hypothetical protein B0E33_29280 [Roseibium aggregatum]